MRIIVAGGRTFNDYPLLSSVLGECKLYFPEFEIVCGEARGADSLGKRWALENNVLVKSFPADWDTFGKSAGYKRNAQMAQYATHLIAFFNGTSRGTKHMIDLADRSNLSICIVNYM